MVWNWRDFLQEMSDAILTDLMVEDYKLPPEVIEKGWVGYDPATEEQIATAEARLGMTLPPSYREFLKVSNGWRVCNPYMENIFPVEKIDFTRNTDPDLIANWEQSRADAAKASVVDIAHTLQISAWTDMAVLLLNPQKTTSKGEWEAWFYSDNIPGAEVFPSFWDLMQDQLTGLLDAVESYAPSPPPPKKDQREVIVAAIEHVCKAWLAESENDPIQPEIDAVYARIRALPGEDQKAFQAGLRGIATELKGSATDTAGDLLINLINSNVSTGTIEFIRRRAYLFVAKVIEMHI